MENLEAKRQNRNKQQKNRKKTTTDSTKEFQAKCGLWHNRQKWFLCVMDVWCCSCVFWSNAIINNCVLFFSFFDYSVMWRYLRSPTGVTIYDLCHSTHITYIYRSFRMLFKIRIHFEFSSAHFFFVQFFMYLVHSSSHGNTYHC